MTAVPPHYALAELVRYATDLFAAAGMPNDRAAIVAALLVEADAMGHDTHGLNLGAKYLDHLQSGIMVATGEPEVITDRGATVVWDGGYLSGVWLTWKAIQTACERAKQYGTVTMAIRRSHHIGCLGAFLPLATEQNLMITLASSDPSVAAVAPHGSYEPVFTPDPLAVGIPTPGDPILIDISASATTMGLSDRARDGDGRLPGQWLIDNKGQASDDPAVLEADPPGALLPLGGLDRGHKGFALGLMVEALTSGLGGFGRANGPSNWGAAVYLQVIDPEALGGLEAFTFQTGWLADRCRAAAVPDGQAPVRLPGDGALARKRQAVAKGLLLYPTIMADLAPWADRLGVAPPAPLS
ncbi:MAG: Ldh family oxidoreductase [Alphaproteobacteria bacterium]|nr:Ldh family oxidoreductase [Alphaproteobacteria bacterium]